MPEFDPNKYIGRPEGYKKAESSHLLALLKNSKLPYSLRQELVAEYNNDEWIGRQLERIYWFIDNTQNMYDTPKPDKEKIKTNKDLIRELWKHFATDWKQRKQQVFNKNSLK